MTLGITHMKIKLTIADFEMNFIFQPSTHGRLCLSGSLGVIDVIRCIQHNHILDDYPLEI